MNKEIYPYLLEPAYKDYIWGGSRIPAVFKRNLPAGIYAESWEVSDRAEGPSIISNGICAGRPLSDLLALHRHSITGTSARTSAFPLLVKLIDAAENLSVQVHPHDSNAHLTGGEPKTEMWYVLDAADDACIYAGLKDGVTQTEFEQAIETSSLDKCLKRFNAHKGDVFFIPGGRVHAIGKGCLLLEVQQNSNTTYRVYDWGRLDSAGKSRPLHLNDALRVIDWDDHASALQPAIKQSSSNCPDLRVLIDTEWFCLKKIDLKSDIEMKTDRSTFHILFSEKGVFEISANGFHIKCPMGQSCLIPASINEWSLSAENGPASILCCTL